MRWAKTLLILIGVGAGIYGLAEAKTGGLVFHNWLLLPPRAYLALLGSFLCLFVAAYMVGRGRRPD